MVDRKPQILRRDKATPCADFWHTLRVGLPIAALLFVALPPLYKVLHSIF